MRSINMTGKNQGQILQSIVRAIKTYHKLLAAHVTNGRLELTLLVTVQVGRGALRARLGGMAPSRNPDASRESSLANQHPSSTQLRKHLPSKVSCYEDNRLLKLFTDIVKALYGCDLVGTAAGPRPSSARATLRFACAAAVCGTPSQLVTHHHTALHGIELYRPSPLACFRPHCAPDDPSSRHHHHHHHHHPQVGEDAVNHWYKRGSHPKGRNVFLKDIEPFIKVETGDLRAATRVRVCCLKDAA
jgi:hypothetical protein